MAISRFAASRVTQGLPKYQSAWDFENVAPGVLEPIASATLLASGTFAFNNIPQTYQDLRLVISSRSNLSGTQDQIAGLFNGDGNARYSFTILNGNGSSSASARGSNQTFWRLGTIPGSTSTSGIFGIMVIDIFNYAYTSTFKTTTCRSAGDLNGSGESRFEAMLYRLTDAITSISFNPLSSGSFAPGSIATLYGIKAGS